MRTAEVGETLSGEKGAAEERTRGPHPSPAYQHLGTALLALGSLGDSQNKKGLSDLGLLLSIFLKSKIKLWKPFE